MLFFVWNKINQRFLNKMHKYFNKYYIANTSKHKCMQNISQHYNKVFVNRTTLLAQLSVGITT